MTGPAPRCGDGGVERFFSFARDFGGEGMDAGHFLKGEVILESGVGGVSQSVIPSICRPPLELPAEGGRRLKMIPFEMSCYGEESHRGSDIRIEDFIFCFWMLPFKGHQAL